jgi:hypothetical protein
MPMRKCAQRADLAAAHATLDTGCWVIAGVWLSVILFSLIFSGIITQNYRYP